MNDYSRIPAIGQWAAMKQYEDISSILESPKRPRYSYHVRLESESSITSEGEESIKTIQGLETEVVQDSSDTDSKADDSDYELIEYEVASLSESDDPFVDYLSTSSGSSNDVPVLELEEVVAAVLADSSLELCDDTDFSSAADDKDDSFGKADFRICAQCRNQNDDPRYRLCTNCFQICWCCKMAKDNNCFPLCSTCYKVRKKFYPPRPRRPRKHRSPVTTTGPSDTEAAVDINKLKSCLDGMSQNSDKQSTTDSGMGSSQEIQQLNLGDIIVPEKLSNNAEGLARNRKRTYSQDSDEFFKPKKTRRDSDKESGRESEEISSSQEKDLEEEEGKEKCIICNVREKNSVYLHGNSAHMCCCYKCAVQSWRTHKKCPICNRKIKNVVKVFKI